MQVVSGMTADDVSDVRPFHFVDTSVAGVHAAVSRTGYTGEDGFEIYVDATDAPGLWDALLEAGAGEGMIPCGLGARDTLRLEAGLRLYGQDMDDDTDPYSCGLGWTVKLDKGEFIGSAALAGIDPSKPPRRFVGIELQGRAIARHGQRVLAGGEGRGGHQRDLQLHAGPLDRHRLAGWRYPDRRGSFHRHQRHPRRGNGGASALLSPPQGSLNVADLSKYRFTASHEWVRIEGSTATVGISDHAQSELGDVIFIELPAVGAVLKAGAKFGAIESVKAASDLYSPVGGTVAAVNGALNDHPELVNSDPYGEGWMLRLEGASDAGADLLDEAGYTKLVGA